MHLDKAGLQGLDKITRLNLVNSITGVKPANLLGTASVEGRTNLAVFSSVVHLGSNPALLGMVLRPAGEVPRHSYANILATGVYTLNAVTADRVQAAHWTSARFERDESEFDACGFAPQWREGFTAPYVEGSPLQIGLRLLEELPVRANGTVLLIGEVLHVYAADTLLNDQGYVDLAAENIVGIGGLNTYYRLNKIGSLPYARVAQKPDWE